MQKTLKDRVKEEMKRRGIKVPTLSEQTKIPKDRIYAWYRDDTNPKTEDQLTLEKWINGDNSIKSGDPPDDTPNNERFQTIINEAEGLKSGQLDNTTLLRILDNLAAGHRETCEANNKLAENEKALIDKIPIVNDVPGTLPVGPSTFDKILELFAELGTGMHWKTKEEGIREVGIRLGLHEGDKSKLVSTLSGGGK